MADGRAGGGRPPWWRGSVRARTTAAATLVMAVFLVAAGAAVLTVLHRNLVDSAGLQAEVTAREVAGEVTLGTPYSALRLPESVAQPVQVVSAENAVLAAGRPLRGAPPFAAFAPAPRAVLDAHGLPGEHHRGDHRDDREDRRHREAVERLRLTRGAAGTAAAFHTMRLRLPGDRHSARDYRVAAVLATTPRGHTVTVYAGASLSTERQAMAGAGDVMLMGLPPLLALMAVVTWLVTRRALRPVEAIRAELAEIMGGDLSRRVPQPPSRDEVARLAATTNATLAALERSVERQRRFVADAAHELRSPIASLRTQLEVARAHPRLLEIDGLIDDTLRLERLAADLLLLARLDAGEPPRGEPVDLAALTRRELARRAADRVPVRAAVPETPVRVTGSAAQLAHVLGNLLDNAQRHAARQVRVTVRPASGGTVVLEVDDDGPGVPPADRERIFERFVRLDDARSRDEGGAGLGLALVRDLVRHHGGRVVAGEAPGGGARFTVTLPAAGDPRA